MPAYGTPLRDLIHFEHQPDGTSRVAPGPEPVRIPETLQPARDYYPFPVFMPGMNDLPPHEVLVAELARLKAERRAQRRERATRRRLLRPARVTP